MAEVFDNAEAGMRSCFHTKTSDADGVRDPDENPFLHKRRGKLLER
jgi:hypothetical protein